MAPEVFFSVCYGDKSPPEAIRGLHSFTPAILDNYCRHRVLGADYPAAVEEEGHSIRGIYATGLTDANMGKLDEFEGAEYKRVQAKVRLLKNGSTDGDETKETSVYLFLNPEALEKREWDFDEFRKCKMQSWTRGGLTFGDGEWLGDFSFRAADGQPTG